VIVHGLLKAAYLGELVTDWCGPSAWVKRFSTQYRGVDYPGHPLVCRGTVTATRTQNGVDLVDLEIWTENTARQTTTRGAATVAFLPPAGAPAPSPRPTEQTP